VVLSGEVIDIGLSERRPNGAVGNCGLPESHADAACRFAERSANGTRGIGSRGGSGPGRARMWDDVVYTCRHQRPFCSESCVSNGLRTNGNRRDYVLDLDCSETFSFRAASAIDTSPAKIANTILIFFSGGIIGGRPIASPPDHTPIMPSQPACQKV
jgi:hypothetical protein